MTRIKAKETESQRWSRLTEKEVSLRGSGYTAIAGIDEAGRGPLAGPVVAAAVILPPGLVLNGLDDSKKVSLAARLRLEKEIKSGAIAWGIGEANHQEIDRVNILNATKLAMSRAIGDLGIKPDYLLIDAVSITADTPFEAIIKGDARVACISAASIIAKTYRDAVMTAFDEAYPEYGFAGHKGYPTAAHREAVLKLGPCSPPNLRSPPPQLVKTCPHCEI